MAKVKNERPNMFRAVVEAEKVSSNPLIFKLLIDTDKGPTELGFTQESAEHLKGALESILSVPPRILRLR